jgi:hypothetical protein
LFFLFILSLQPLIELELVKEAFTDGLHGCGLAVDWAAYQIEDFAVAPDEIKVVLECHQGLVLAVSGIVLWMMSSQRLTSRVCKSIGFLICSGYVGMSIAFMIRSIWLTSPVYRYVETSRARVLS